MRRSRNKKNKNGGATTDDEGFESPGANGAPGSPGAEDMDEVGVEKHENEDTEKGGKGGAPIATPEGEGQPESLATGEKKEMTVGHFLA